MKNISPNKILNQGLVMGALLLGFNAGALQRAGSIERLTYACQQELQTICARQNEPREAVMCLKENEPLLQTQACIDEVNLLNQELRYIPTPMEEPYREPDTNEIQ